MLAPKEIAEIDEIDDVEEIIEGVHDRPTPVHIIQWVVPVDRPSDTGVRPIGSSERLTILPVQPKPSLPAPIVRVQPKRPPPPRPSSQAVLNHIWHVGEEDVVIETDKEVLTDQEVLYAHLWQGAQIEVEGNTDETLDDDWFANPRLR